MTILFKDRSKIIYDIIATPICFTIGFIGLLFAMAGLTHIISGMVLNNATEASMAYSIFSDGLFMLFSAIGFSYITESLSKNGCNLNDILIIFIPFDAFLAVYIPLIILSMYNMIINQDALHIQGLLMIWIISIFKNFVLFSISAVAILIKIV